jgi:hypothetical protein
VSIKRAYAEGLGALVDSLQVPPPGPGA